MARTRQAPLRRTVQRDLFGVETMMGSLRPLQYALGEGRDVSWGFGDVGENGFGGED